MILDWHIGIVLFSVGGTISATLGFLYGRRIEHSRRSRAVDGREFFVLGTE